MRKSLRNLPSIHVLLKDDRIKDLTNKKNIPLYLLKKWIREELDCIRREIIEGKSFMEIDSKDKIKFYILRKLEMKSALLHQYNLKHVINATGTVLHTNFGRSRLSKEAINQVVLAAKNYTNLEYDLVKGVRGSRNEIVESILTELTGCESAMVVNNNAAAVFLILRVFAFNKEVIVSRGEIVEIGGSFRISTIMEESGAILKEVGTTNKTHLFDYEEAINENTRIILKVHTSNFKTIGFTESVTIDELVNISRGNDQLIVYGDLGSGAFYDFKLNNEPIISDILKTGVHIISFSGDKLLGGPQAGIILGKKALIDQLKKHPLARVLRVDKMTLAALEATLKSYMKGKVEDIPTVRDILIPISEIQRKVNSFIKIFNPYREKWELEIKEDFSKIGGGAMPDVDIPTLVITLKHLHLNAQYISNYLRLGNPAVITRIKDDKIIIDLRTVDDEEIPLLVNSIASIN